LAGSNVGSLYGIRAAPMAATQVDKAQVPSKGQGVEKQEDLITIGFRVKPKEKAIIQDYVNRYTPIRSRIQKNGRECWIIPLADL